VEARRGDVFRPGVQYAGRRAPRPWLLGGVGRIDGTRGLRIAAVYVRAAFDSRLLGLPAPLLDGPSPAYPEVRFERP